MDISVPPPKTLHFLQAENEESLVGEHGWGFRFDILGSLLIERVFQDLFGNIKKTRIFLVFNF